MIKVTERDVSQPWTAAKQLELIIKCPTCKTSFIVLAFTPGICSYCREEVPDVRRLMDSQLARLRYHFDQDKPIIYTGG